MSERSSDEHDSKVSIETITAIGLALLLRNNETGRTFGRINYVAAIVTEQEYTQSDEEFPDLS